MSGPYLLLPAPLVIFISLLIVRAEAVERGRHWFPAPKADRIPQKEDRLVKYGLLVVRKTLLE
jgi:hypothetical protein